MENLLANIEVVSESGCWIWMRGLTGAGYAVTYKGKKQLSAHRLAYELFVGPIPRGMQIDHLCRVTCCVNPYHLEVVTPQINTIRGIGPTAKNALKTHCIRGHEFTPENTKLTSKGRNCKACWSEVHNPRNRDRKRRAKQCFQ